MIFESGKVLMCPLHGGIKVNHQEVDVIDHKLFQRLRFISQNDVLQFAFSGATHNRFSHSIGAMHVAGRFFDSAIENTLTKYKKITYTLSDGEKEAIDYFRQVLRLSVLLHDVGHGAFSHQSERCKALTSVTNYEGKFDDMWKDIEDRELWFDHSPHELHHEHYSIRVAYEILSNTPSIKRDLMLDVISLLDGTNFFASTSFIEYFSELPEVIKHIFENGEAYRFMEVLSSLVSGVLDADRLDYLMRDSLYTGTHYGKFDLDMICTFLSFHSDNEWNGLAIREQGEGAIEDFLHGRMRAYRQVYQHKTARGCIGYILHRSIEEVMSNVSFAEIVKEASSNLDKFFMYNDTLFWNEFTNHAMNHPDSMCARLIYRKPVKHLKTIDTSRVMDQDKYKFIVADKLNIPSDNVACMIDKFSFAPKNGSKKADLLRVLNGHPLNSECETIKLCNALPLYETFQRGRIIYTFLEDSKLNSN